MADAAIPAMSVAGWREARRQLNELSHVWQSTGEPVDVSFRDLVKDLPYSDRVTHFVHPYPGKLLFHIPAFLLRAFSHDSTPIRVLDPFCGSGTTLVEAALVGATSVGLDVNPFATLLSKVKTTPLNVRQLIALGDAVCHAYQPSHTPPAIPNPEHWYTEQCMASLSGLLTAIQAIQSTEHRNALMVAFSSTATTLSLCDPRVPVPVRVNLSRTEGRPALRRRFHDVIERAKTNDARPTFRAAVEALAFRISRLPNQVGQVTTHNRSALKPCEDLGDFDLVLTSPPYCAAQKYIRASSLPLGWLGLCVAKDQSKLKKLSIGRERVSQPQVQGDYANLPESQRELVRAIQLRNPVRAKIAGTYLVELAQSIRTTTQVIRPGGWTAIVVANNLVAGKPFPTAQFVKQMLEQSGLTLVAELRDTIRSRKLMTKRRSTVQTIDHEHVLIAHRRE